MKKPTFEGKAMVLALGAFGFFAVGAIMTTAIPLLAAVGPWPVLGISCGAMAVWFGIVFLPRLLRKP